MCPLKTPKYAEKIASKNGCKPNFPQNEVKFEVHVKGTANNACNETSWFKLQVKRSKLCQPRMPLLPYPLECHICGMILIAMTSGRGWNRKISCRGPGAGASGKNVSRPTTGLKKVQQSSGVSVVRNFFSHLFLNEPVPGTPRDVCITFATSTRTSDCVGPKWCHINAKDRLNLDMFKATT